MTYSICYGVKNIILPTLEKMEKKDRVQTLGTIAIIETLSSFILLVVLIGIMRLSGGRFSKLVTRGFTIGVAILTLNAGFAAAITGISCAEIESLNSRNH